MSEGIPIPAGFWQRKTSRKWTIDGAEKTLQRNEEWLFESLNLTLRFARAYNYEDPPLLLRNLDNGWAGGEDADAVIVLLGSHYNWDPGYEEKYHGSTGAYKDFRRLRKDLNRWCTLHSSRVCIVVEHLGQHYDNWHRTDLGNVFKRNSKKADDPNSMACAPIIGPTNDFRQLLLREIFAKNETANNVVRVSSWDLFRSKWNLHPGSHLKKNDNIDCTHYCWSSQLWRPLWQRLFYALLFRQ
jgi:hypothetical protein